MKKWRFSGICQIWEKYAPQRSKMANFRRLLKTETSRGKRQFALFDKKNFAQFWRRYQRDSNRKTVFYRAPVRHVFYSRLTGFSPWLSMRRSTDFGAYCDNQASMPERHTHFGAGQILIGKAEFPKGILIFADITSKHGAFRGRRSFETNKALFDIQNQ